MSDTMPRGQRIAVSFDIALPARATQEQVLEWVKFASGFSGSMPSDNPLVDHDMEAITEPVLSDMGRLGRRAGERSTT